MANDFQTGGEHKPGANTQTQDGTVIEVSQLATCTYGGEVTQTTFMNASPVHKVHDTKHKADINVHDK